MHNTKRCRSLAGAGIFGDSVFLLGVFLLAWFVAGLLGEWSYRRDERGARLEYPAATGTVSPVVE